LTYKISRYNGGRNDEVAALILSIQNGEAELNLSIAEQPDLQDVSASYGEGGFWIAEYEGRLVGSIGLLPYGERAALKNFFVAAEHRGPNGPARRLFELLLQTALDRGYKDIFLDTPSVATRSHAFYLRVGFERCERQDLPAGYDFPDRLSLVFRRRL